jgi:hypothetical protein
LVGAEDVLRKDPERYQRREVVPAELDGVQDLRGALDREDLGEWQARPS